MNSVRPLGLLGCTLKDSSIGVELFRHVHMWRSLVVWSTNRQPINRIHGNRLCTAMPDSSFSKLHLLNLNLIWVSGESVVINVFWTIQTLHFPLNKQVTSPLMSLAPCSRTLSVSTSSFRLAVSNSCTSVRPILSECPQLDIICRQTCRLREKVVEHGFTCNRAEQVTIEKLHLISA